MCAGTVASTKASRDGWPSSLSMAACSAASGPLWRRAKESVGASNSESMEADEAAADAGIKKDPRREPQSGKWILGLEQGFRSERLKSGARNEAGGCF